MTTKTQKPGFKQLVVRGDRLCYLKQNNGFPFIDKVAKAGASGVHIWFWDEEKNEGAHGIMHTASDKTRSYLKIKDEFIGYCHDKDLGVHLGIGIGAYGVCDGEDPANPRTMRKIKEYMARVLDAQDIDGVELQTGEYDNIEYKGDSAKGKPHAQKLVDTLNPYLYYLHQIKSSLWLRTELLVKNFTASDIRYVSQNLYKNCTVEWSHGIGPFTGEDAFEKGRQLLKEDKRFSWFLKTDGGGGPSVGKENYNRENMPFWVEHYREWIKMLYENERKTLTICHLPEHDNECVNLLIAVVQLARDLDMSNEKVLSVIFPNTGRSQETPAAAKIHPMTYRIIWTWDSWICDASDADSFVTEYKRLIDFMAEWGYNGLIIWGFIDDRHGGEASAREVAEYGAKKGVRILSSVGAGGYGGFVQTKHKYNLPCFLKEHPELRAIPRNAWEDEPSNGHLCLYQDKSIQWLREGSSWLAQNFDIGGVKIETNESGNIDKCRFASEATKAEINRLRYGCSFSDMVRVVPPHTCPAISRTIAIGCDFRSFETGQHFA